jgi:hypothetical protein
VHLLSPHLKKLKRERKYKEIINRNIVYFLLTHNPLNSGSSKDVTTEVGIEVDISF